MICKHRTPKNPRPMFGLCTGLLLSFFAGGVILCSSPAAAQQDTAESKKKPQTEQKKERKKEQKEQAKKEQAKKEQAKKEQAKKEQAKKEQTKKEQTKKEQTKKKKAQPKKKAGAKQKPKPRAATKPTDQQITDHVEDELLKDDGVNSLRIDIETSEGVVTLRGSTRSLLSKRRAEKIAEAIRGVRAVVNMIEVEPLLTRDDQEIRSDIGAALLVNPATEAYEVEVQVNDGTAQLSGSVDSWQEKNLAEKVAAGVRGVKGVKNNITVNAPDERPDTEIKADVEQALRWNVLVDQEGVEVQVDDGRITLSGTVGSASEKSQAFYSAWVAGVRSVNDENVTVQDISDPYRREPFTIESTAELKDAIEDALIYDPRVLSFNVEPEVVGSTVTLRGEVTSLQAKRAAEQTVHNVVGVTEVYNRLKVTGATRSDEEIESEIKAALIRDPYVERFEITPSVLDGVVRLYGNVDSGYEKVRAEDVAADIRGVYDVKNFLTVSGRNEPYVYDPYIDEHYGAETFTEYEGAYTGKSDAEIESDIDSELWWSPFVDSDEVLVEVENGVATLTGTVDSWAERQSAAENAIEGGAVSVNNELVIDYQ